MSDVTICDSCGKVIRLWWSSARVNVDIGESGYRSYRYCSRCGNHLIRELDRAKKATIKKVHEKIEYTEEESKEQGEEQ